MFEGLTALDREGQIVPSLAVKWRRVDELAWEFDLKRHVTFHDGSPFEAEDVLASFERLRWIARGGLNNNQILAVIRDLRAIDSHRLRITTVAPHLALLLDLVEIHIIQRRFVHATTMEFDSGRAAIGTGPFRQIERDPIELRLAAFADYHGTPAAWAEVDFREVKTRAENYELLNKGEIDLVYALPLDWRADYAPKVGVQGISAVGIASQPGLMLTFLAPCFLPHSKGGCRDAQGRNLDQNPLIDRRVRAAFVLRHRPGVHLPRVAGRICAAGGRHRAGLRLRRRSVAGRRSLRSGPRPRFAGGSRLCRRPHHRSGLFRRCAALSMAGTARDRDYAGRHRHHPALDHAGARRAARSRQCRPLWAQIPVLDLLDRRFLLQSAAFGGDAGRSERAMAPPISAAIRRSPSIA